MRSPAGRDQTNLSGPALIISSLLDRDYDDDDGDDNNDYDDGDDNESQRSCLAQALVISSLLDRYDKNDDTMMMVMTMITTMVMAMRADKAVAPRP